MGLSPVDGSSVDSMSFRALSTFWVARPYLYVFSSSIVPGLCRQIIGNFPGAGVRLMAGLGSLAPALGPEQPLTYLHNHVAKVAYTFHRGMLTLLFLVGWKLSQ